MNSYDEVLKFLDWMHKNKIDRCIPFFAIQEGRDPKIPVWTNGNKLFNAQELTTKYQQSNGKS